MHLSNHLSQYQIILASQSPRRIQFLKDLDIPFEIKPTQVEEIYDEKLSSYQITDYLCQLKADAFVLENNKQLIITCDTIVWHEEKALGKPQNFQEAFDMIASLRNKTHQVISSICIKTTNKKTVIHDITKVTFGNLTDTEIAHYIHTYQPYDKAGAYGIQEWIGLIGIQKIEGSYTNVVGMPMEKLYNALKSF